MWISLVGIVVVTGFFIYASIREYGIRERKSQEQSDVKDDMKALESQLEVRLESIEKKLKQ